MAATPRASPRSGGDVGPGLILLASASPQRRTLLESLGVPFRVVVSGVEEGTDPAENAAAKARAVAREHGVPRGGGVLGADTEVILDGRVFGKAADVDQARGMLGALAGRTHTVRTAICLITETSTTTATDDVRVSIRPASPAMLEWYLATGEWRDRAGAYAIQGVGAALVSHIVGDHSAVVGLPLGGLVPLLEGAGLVPWVTPRR